MYRAINETETRLLLKTLVKRELKSVILPLSIFPFIIDTTIHTIANVIKNGICAGRYDSKLVGLDHRITIKDIVNITKSNSTVNTLYLLFSKLFHPKDQA
jgi:hypothetical protein